MLRSMKNIKQIFRFGVIGVVNTGFSYSLYIGFLGIGLAYQSANLAALLLGMLFSFRTQGTLVFRNGDRKLFFRFLLVWMFIYLGNIAFIGAMLEHGFDAYFAGAVAILPIAVVSYFLQRFFVFSAKF
jgi:putative flippase GtrA